MPLFFQHTINDTTRVAIWKITEEEAFFSSPLPWHREISHPHKRLQHLAGRFLLQHLFPGFPFELLVIADTRKPYLSNEAFHFSISHCNEYAAAIVSTHQRVGVDIEHVRPQISAIRKKFLSEEEFELLNQSYPDLEERLRLTMAWSSKEALYKWYGYGGVDFRKHMVLTSAEPANGYWIDSRYLFAKESEAMLSLHCKVFDNLVLAFVTSID